MGCPNNIKKHKLFGFNWSSEGGHDIVINSISKFMDCSNDFVVYGKCLKCKSEFKRSFVKWEELIRAGLSINTLERVTTTGYYPPPDYSANDIF